MTPFPYTIEKTSSLEEAKDIMAEKEIRHLPVVSESKVYGMISDRDIKWALDPVFNLGTASEIPVERICRKDAFVVSTNTPVVEVLEHMHEKKIGSTIVTKNDIVVGIFTTHDICREYANLIKVIEPDDDDDKVA